MLGGQILQEKPAARKKRQTMILDGVTHGDPRAARKEKTISEEINEENEQSSTGDDNSDARDIDSSSNESEEQAVFNKRVQY